MVEYLETIKIFNYINTKMQCENSEYVNKR